jgi:hypothetical protein
MDNMMELTEHFRPELFDDSGIFNGHIRTVVRPFVMEIRVMVFCYFMTV